jgi:hypothetical protein
MRAEHGKGAFSRCVPKGSVRIGGPSGADAEKNDSQ